MNKKIDLQALRTRWYKLCGQDPRKENLTLDLIFSGIAKRYSEPHRRYHTLAHVEEMLVLLEKYHSLAHNYFDVAFAIWFHDIVWDPKAKNNEEMSAFYAPEALKVILSQLPICQAIVKEDIDTAIKFHSETVRGLIMATKHSSRQEDQDCQLICDFDLYRLIGDNQKEDIEDVWFEYAHLSDEQKTREQLAFFDKMQNRGYIFQTETFKSQFEEKAIKNVAAQNKKFSRLAQNYDRKANRPKIFSFL